MKKHIKTGVTVLVCILLIFTAGVFAEGTYPNPTSEFYVNDFANVLSSDTESLIASAGRQLENDTGAQVVVVTVDSLNGQDIKSYSFELASQWGIGQKDKDNGILILNSVSDRKVRIEVGYGLEPTFGAIRAGEIIDNVITPRLKEGDYDKGLLNGYAEVVKRIAEENGLDSSKYFNGENIDTGWREQRSSNNRRVGFTPLILIILLIIDGIFFRFRITSALIKIIFWSNIFRGGGRGGWGGGGFGGWGGGGFGGGSGGGGGGGSSGGGGTFGGGGSDSSY